MALTPGRALIWAGPTNMYWAPVGTKLPGLDVPFNPGAPTNSLWPAGWRLIYDVTNAIAVRPRNPQEVVGGEFRGVAGVVPAGSGGRGGGGGGRGGGGGGGGRGGGRGGGAAEGAGVSIGLEIETPEVELWRQMDNFSKAVEAAQAAQRTFTVSGAPTANGNLSVVLNGATPVSIAVLSSDTTSSVATKIAAGTYTGWSAVANGSVVTFTASASGLKQGTFSITGPTGFTGQFSTVHPGHYGVEGYYIDQTKQFPIMFGMEMLPHSSTPDSHMWEAPVLLRAFGLTCYNTETAEDLWGNTGSNSLLTPNINLECIPGTIDPMLLAGTGYENIADIYGRFFYAAAFLSDPSS